MSANVTQQELLTLFEQSRQVISHFISSRSEAEQTSSGTAEARSAKDLLAEVAFWMEYMVTRMQYFQRGEAAPREVDFTALSRQVSSTSQRQPWQQVSTSAIRNADSLIATVRQFSDEHLQATNSYDNAGSGPLWGEVRANGFIFPLQEIEKYYRHSGETAQADSIAALLSKVVIETEPETISVPLIDAMKLDQRLSQPDVPLIIDVRGKSEYAAGHISGAINIPLADLDRAEIAEGREVVTYCNMHHRGQSRGEHAAALLNDRGIKASALNGGFPHWRDAGLSVSKGK
ncbi:MAG: rhodanese-like domain-containing protein [Anaerolineae bacterium]|nr:rhodanese-like domain-containing protein [Anaerolineae bacterium]